MKSEPQRLLRGGGNSARLLESAGMDRPSPASRARALELAATAGAFVATTAVAAGGSSAAAGSPIYKSVAAWVCIGALGGGAVAFGVSQLLGPSEQSQEQAPPVLLEPEMPTLSPTPPAPAVAAPGIVAEPAASAPMAVQPLAAVKAALEQKDFKAALELLEQLDSQRLSDAERQEAQRLRAAAKQGSQSAP